jgi:WD40 repeat protein
MVLLGSLTAAFVLAPQAAAVSSPVGTPRVVPGLRPLAFSAANTGRRVAMTLEDGNVRILDPQTRVTLRQLAKHPQPAYAVDWSDDDRLIATGDESGRVWVAVAATGSRSFEWRTHSRGVQKVSFNRGRTLLATTGKDDTIRIYGLEKQLPKEQRLILGKGANFYGATFSPILPFQLTTGILAAAGRVYDAQTGAVRRILTGHNNQGVFEIAYNRAGTRIATAGRDSNASLFDARTGARLGSFKGHADWVNNLAFSPNGRLLATGSTDRTVRVWNVQTFRAVATIENQSFVGSPVVFTSDGRFLLTVNDAGFLQINPIAAGRG